jgi:hypothetical protein
MEESKPQTPNPNEIPTAKPQQIPNVQSGKARKPYDLRDRTFEFAVRILDIVEALPPVGYAKIADQRSRSGSSVGANGEEADGALSRPDKRKAFVIDRKLGKKVPVRADLDEASELVYILSAIICKLE